MAVVVGSVNVLVRSLVCGWNVPVKVIWKSLWVILAGTNGIGLQVCHHRHTLVSRCWGHWKALDLRRLNGLLTRVWESPAASLERMDRPGIIIKVIPSAILTPFTTSKISLIATQNSSKSKLPSVVSIVCVQCREEGRPPLSTSARSQMASSWALSSSEFSRTAFAWYPERYPSTGFIALKISQYLRCSASVIRCCCADDILARSFFSGAALVRTACQNSPLPVLPNYWPRTFIGLNYQTFWFLLSRRRTLTASYLEMCKFTNVWKINK